MQFNSWLLNDNILKQNVFEYIVENSYREVLTVFGKYITRDISNSLLNDRMNVFHYAAKSKNIYAILYLYDIFYSKYHIEDCINKSSLKNQIKPIHSACYSDDAKTVETIIDLGGDINAVDHMQMTPLHIAVTKLNTRIAKKLILNGASKDIKNSNNKSAYDLSLTSNHPILTEILAKKSLYQLLFKCEIEYTSLKNTRKDHVIIIIILFVLCIQLSFYTIIHTSKPQRNEESYCLMSSANCIGEMILFSLGIVFELGILCILLLFSILHSRYQALSIDQLEQLEIKTLSDIYLTNENMCIKCKKNTISTTIHCISCDKCIEHWDHHCFYLNCCIHSGNKKYFKLFCVVACGVVIINAINCTIYLIILCLEKSKELIAFMFFIEVTVSSVMVIRVISSIIFGFLIIGYIYTLFSMIVPFMMEAKEKKNRNSSVIDSTISLIKDI